MRLKGTKRFKMKSHNHITNPRHSLQNAFQKNKTINNELHFIFKTFYLLSKLYFRRLFLFSLFKKFSHLFFYPPLKYSKPRAIISILLADNARIRKTLFISKIEQSYRWSMIAYNFTIKETILLVSPMYDSDNIFWLFYLQFSYYHARILQCVQKYLLIGTSKISYNVSYLSKVFQFAGIWRVLSNAVR